LILTSPVIGQKRIDKKDSIQVQNVCESFFAWYTDLIKDETISNFNPQFVKTANGMTGLDYTNYRTGLRKHGFTDELIEKRVKSFEKCDRNLGTVTYERFVQFQDLDDFRNIECDFSNAYEFTGGMDPIDGANLTDIQLDAKDKVIATLVTYYIVGNEKYLMNKRKLTLTKKKTGWKISDFTYE
jgi:hypothetical protein